jgi:acetylglutamate kinase
MSQGPLIVKIGGAGVEEPAAAGALWKAVAEVHRILSGRLILVHGGGRAVDAHLERLGFATERRDGIRITPEDQIGEIAAVLAGRINKALVGAIQTHGVRAVGLCLGDGLAVRTAKAEQYSFDPGRVGAVIGGDATLLRMLMEGAFLPVLCSIGLDDAGRFLNVNADDAAAGIAAGLHARGLVLLTDVPGIMDEQGQLIARITPAEVTRLIERGVIKGGMIPKATAAARAAAAASAPATIASWNTPSDLVRIARGEPAGTTVLPG